MVRVAISVEGETEESFVKTVLCPHLQSSEVFVTPINMRGSISVKKAVEEIKKLVHGFEYVTTLYDFYGFKGNTGYDKDGLENAILAGVPVDKKNVVQPYVQMYEYEGILFSDPKIMSSVVKETKSGWAKSVLEKFNNSPETINNSTETAPSKRLEKNTDYKKTTHGSLIAESIGISKIKEMCPNFKAWVEQLENL